MISFIIPTRDKKKLKNFKYPDSEVIPIEGAKSFFDAWREGLKRANGEYIVLTHDDTEYLEIPRLEVFLKDDVGMVGVAGTTVLHPDQPWWFSKERLFGGILSGEITHRDRGVSVYGPLGEVVVLDGVCLITTKKILEDVGIPQKDYAEWDFYDHILSLEYIKKGYKLKTIPIKMIHNSVGGGQGTFEKNMDKFKEEYLTQIWRI